MRIRIGLSPSPLSTIFSLFPLLVFVESLDVYCYFSPFNHFNFLISKRNTLQWRRTFKSALYINFLLILLLLPRRKRIVCSWKGLPVSLSFRGTFAYSGFQNKTEPLLGPRINVYLDMPLQTEDPDFTFCNKMLSTTKQHLDTFTHTWKFLSYQHTKIKQSMLNICVCKGKHLQESSVVVFIYTSH